MNRRIIKSILKNKFNSFCKSIKDPKVRKLVSLNSIITGGSIVSLLEKQKVNDFDLYFTDKETTLAVAKYYVAQFNKLHKGKDSTRIKPPEVWEDKDRVRILIKSTGIAGDGGGEKPEEFFTDILEEIDTLDGVKIDDKKKSKYRPIFLTDNAITLSDGIQLIIRFYGSPEEIHENFDFVHCINYWISKDNHLELIPAALESILTKQLHYVNSKYPVCAFIRTRKFIKRGWHINAGEMLKICFQISTLDLTDIKVLEDQLIGVDTAYFTHLINALKAKQSKDPNFHINLPYIVSIVDKIF